MEQTNALDREMMARAFQLARQAAAHGNEPFGALLVRDGQILMENENQIHTAADPTFHAELGLIRRFCAETGETDLSGCTLYSSCEPCFMCSGAMVWARVGRLVFGAYDEDYCAIRGFAPNECSQLIFRLSPWAPQVTGGVLREEAKAILADYFARH